MDQLDDTIGRRLSLWIRLVCARPRAFGCAILALTLPLTAYTALNLGVNSDNVSFLAENVPSRIALEEFAELFPILNNSLLVVVDGKTPELTREAARGLAQRLAEQPDRYREVYLPGSGEFFDRNGLLYLDAPQLEAFADHMARMQPVLAELEHDASLANFSRVVQQALDEGALTQRSDDEWPAVLDSIADATVSVYSEHPLEISWEELLLQSSPLSASTRQVLLVEPVLDFSSLLGAGRAIDGIRTAALDLGYEPERGVRVRVTGNPALNHEEMVGLLWDIGGAGVFCFLLVALIIARALRSLALTVAALVTLLIGLLWTAAFAAAAIGHLNLVSISFAILFIGLGVDFCIHLGMQYVALRRLGVAHVDGFAQAARSVGSSLVLCTLTTAIGFYVFIPTDYTGVAELGLISGTGMIVILFMTLTLFPALVTAWLPFEPGGRAAGELRLGAACFRVLRRRAGAVRVAALALALCGLALLPRAEFDPNAVLMRDQSTESVQTFNDLLDDDELSSPWFANALASDLPAAVVLSERFARLETVGRVLTLQDFVPRDQEEKRTILADLALLLDTPPAPPGREPKQSAQVQLQALAELRDFLDGAVVEGDSALAASMAKLEGELSRLLERAEAEADAGAVMADFERVLLGDFASHMRRLRRSLDPEVVTLASLPSQLVSRMIAPDGRARVQIYPKHDLSEPLALERFADSITAIDPSATGMALNLVGFGHATVASFEQALVTAIVAITLLLWLLWQRAREVLLVLAPLLLGALLTVASMVLLGISFNFINVLVVPLILGIGVDSGIHLVHRAKHEGLGAGELMGSTTARAVFYSAFTTVASFGSLTLSSHRGMMGLGAMLVAGLLFILFSNLVVLPALLLWRRGAPIVAAKHSEA